MCKGAGAMFNEVEIESADGEWVDYDEKVSLSDPKDAVRTNAPAQAALPVGVSNIKGEWSRA